MDGEKECTLSLDARSPVPVYEQVKQGIKAWILSGNLGSGDRLPAIRDLARRLQINPNTVVKVYYQLQVEGYVEGQAGTGYFVQPLPEGREALRQEQMESETQHYLERMARLGCTVEEVQTLIKLLWRTGEYRDGASGPWRKEEI